VQKILDVTDILNIAWAAEGVGSLSQQNQTGNVSQLDF